MIDTRGLLILIVDAIVLAIIVLRPMTRSYDDSDRGEGNQVVMVPPLKPSYLRCGVFIATSFVASFFLVEVKSPSLENTYHLLVTELLLSVIPNPKLVDGFAQTLLPVFQVSVIAFGLSFAVAFRASLARRVMILLNVCFFLVVSVVVDAFFGIFVLTTGFPLGPTPVINLLLQYLIAGIVMFRVAFTSFQMPRKTQLPILRSSDLLDDIILIICVLVSVVATIAGATWLVSKFGDDPVVTAAIAFACPPYLLIFITVSLGLVRLVRPRHINPTSHRPPVEVIIPAYNEELNIGDLLRSIDDAAERYQGPVRVVLCDDGSIDNTRALATEAIDNFRYATGVILEGGHRGKSQALNTALDACRADIVYRVDADCIVHPDCLVYSVPYFVADPKIGMVGAFVLPKEPYATWIDRMRMFEMIPSFGMGRPANDVVDGIACIPGTFTAFRRQVAVEIGGFVEGMYGEDLDFTCAVARVGYRVVVDTRIRSYEDVPNTQKQLRVQRTRWNRGGSMAYARYVPVVTGFAGPRFWFFTTRSAAKRYLVPLHLTTLAYIIILALFNPTSHLNLARVAFILGFKALPALVEVTALSIYYGKGRYLGWLPLRYPFVILKHYYGLEAFLSFNARPVITPRIAEALRPPIGRGVEVEPAEAT